MSNPLIPVSLITGTILDAQGEARVGVTVQFVPLSTPYIASGDVVSTLSQSAVTDHDGYISLNLAYGSYRVIVGETDAFNIAVPSDGLPHNLVSLISSPLPVVSVGNGTLVVDVGALALTLPDTKTIRWTRKGDPNATRTRLAVIGSYGSDGVNEGSVSTLVHAWQPSALVAAGDNNYPIGAVSTIDDNVGKYYHDFIYPYTGSYGAGAVTNKFHPVPGDVDWLSGITPYLNYFSGLGGLTYYKKTIGDAEFFFCDSDANEPAGIGATGTQATWLQTQLAASTARWKIVVFHHAPYSSASGYTDTWMSSWDFALWGANVVITGGPRIYERIVKSGVTYLNVGTGGKTLDSVGAPVADSVFQVADFGALCLDYNAYSLKFRFCSTLGEVLDSGELLAANTNQLYAAVKFNHAKGLKVGDEGLEVDFTNIGFLQSIFSEALEQWLTSNVAGGSAYIYVAYASDDQGTDFTMTFNQSLDFIAFKISATPILVPSASDFAGLWKCYNGGQSAANIHNTVYVDIDALALRSLGLPAYETLQDAYDYACANQTGISRYLICVGAGTSADFGGVELTTAWNTYVEIEGLSESLSAVGIIGESTENNPREISMNANNISIAGVYASAANSSVGKAGANITLEGNAHFGVVRAQGKNMAGGHISVTGGKVTSITTSGTTATVSLHSVSCGDITSSGGDISIENSVVNNVTSSFIDADGNSPTGHSGDIVLVDTQAALLKAEGTAWVAAPGGPESRNPIRGGTINLTDSTAQALSTKSNNFYGGNVILKNSEVGNIDTRCTHATWAYPSGDISITKSTTGNIVNNFAVGHEDMSGSLGVVESVINGTVEVLHGWIYHSRITAAGEAPIRGIYSDVTTPNLFYSMVLGQDPLTPVSIKASTQADSINMGFCTLSGDLDQTLTNVLSPGYNLVNTNL